MASITATQQHHHPATLEEVRTLWIGDLQFWVDEFYLNSCFAHTGELVSIKIIRNKITGQPEGYGFVEFLSHAAAERILQTYNGTPMPGTDQMFRLNWASFGIGERRTDPGPEHSIFVGDLAPDVTDYLLQETFRAHYPSIRGAKVVTDPNTGCSKGAMRISAATPKKTTAFQQQYAVAKAVHPAPAYTTPVQVLPPDNDNTNTTIFVGNLDPNVAEEELKQFFLPLGEIIFVKIPAAKGCGFVQFATRTSAEEAIQRMQGQMIGQQVVCISWGRSPTAKQDLPGSWGAPVDPSQWSAYYGYGQGYDAYAYGAMQDPSLYAYGAYAGYAQYPQQVEGSHEMAAMVGAVPAVEQREESYDPLATPDVDKLNATYLSVHGSAILGRPLWLRASSISQQA
ncbi:hypothetical protein REPUB_Repub05bG0107600 [Reevesia pubescens]